METKYAIKLETRRVAERNFPYSPTAPLANPQAIVDFCRSLQDSDVEKMLVLYLDNGNRLNCIQMWEGTLNHAIIYPREVIKYAILSTSNQIVLVHNHPGAGIVEPSLQDIGFTQNLQKACALLDISILDHLIIGSEGYYSFAIQKII